ncbi:MAG: WxcM-like domain-containing protein [Actinobacteria bacterium]|nr:WxcM-like domain-containing protein [Actinomycetota bacterium]
MALCESSTIGPGTRVWAFAHVLPGAQLGAECNVCDGVFVESDVVIGDRVTIKGGVQLWNGLRVGNDVFIGPNATFTNDPFPRSKVYPDAPTLTKIDDGASLGANCTVLPGVLVGRNAMVGAGAVVTKDVPPNAKVVGNPARIIGYIGAEHPDRGSKTVAARVDDGMGVASASGDVRLVVLPTYTDLRGDLTVAELEQVLPFTPRRFFIVHDVPGRDVRGEHAHKRCHQFLLCARGSVRLLVDDGSQRAEMLLDRPSVGMYIPPGIWGSQYDFADGSVLAVFASEPYDPDDYLRTYEEFLAFVASQPAMSGPLDGLD